MGDDFLSRTAPWLNWYECIMIVQPVLYRTFITVQPRHSENRTNVLTAAAPLFSSYTGAQHMELL